MGFFRFNIDEVVRLTGTSGLGAGHAHAHAHGSTHGSGIPTHSSKLGNSGYASYGASYGHA